MKRMINIGTWAAAFDSDGILWLSDFKFGGLYKYDLYNKELSFVHSFMGTNGNCEAMHYDMKIHDNTIYLLPLRDKYVRIYDISEEQEKIISFPLDISAPIEFCSLEVDRGFIIYSNDIEKIFIFDVYKKEVYLDDNLTQIIMRIKKQFCDKCIIKANANHFFFLVNGYQVIRCLDITNMDTYDINCEHFLGEVNNIQFNNGTYWIQMKNSSAIYTMNEYNNIEMYLPESEKFLNAGGNIPYSSIYFWNDYILLLNYYLADLTYMKKEDGKIKVLARNDEDFRVPFFCGGGCFHKAIEKDGHLFVVPQMADVILEYDENLKIVNSYSTKTCISEEINPGLLDVFFKNRIYIEDENIFCLQNYLYQV